jgi:hypothetical protein
MGSSPTLDQASPSWDLDGISTQLALQQRIADAQPITRDLEQAFDRLNPNYGLPADTHNPYGRQPCTTGRPPSRSAPGSRSPAAARTTPTRSCGWPARTTEPPTPPAPPASRPSASGTARNGSAPNANCTTLNTSTKEP